LSEEMQLSTKSSGKGRRVKRKYFFIGFFSGIVFFIAFVFVGDALLNEEYDEVTIEDFEPHHEADFSMEGAMAELKPKDRWMLQYIDPPAGVDPKDVFVFDCETVDRKVESLTTFCADFGIAVWKIKWSMWSANGAEGSGIYMANDCEPSCAEGSYLEMPVNVYLSDLTTDGKNYFLNTATIVPSNLQDQKGPIVGGDGTAYFTLTTKVKGKEVSAEIWDIASFYREMPNMRMKRPD
jgi:hypothetical protein